MNIGKLYQINKYCWLLYPTKDIAAAVDANDAYADAGALVATVATVAALAAAWWSKEFNCNVTYIPENSIFCLLEQDGKYLKVLSTNGELGWIIYREEEDLIQGSIEEVKQ